MVEEALPSGIQNIRSAEIFRKDKNLWFRYKMYNTVFVIFSTGSEGMKQSIVMQHHHVVGRGSKCGR